MQASKHESRLNVLALFIIGDFAPPVSYLPLAVVCAKCCKQLLLDAGGYCSSVRRRSARRTLQGRQQCTAIGAQPSCRYAIEWAAALFEKLGIAVRAELEDVLLEQLCVVHPVKGPASRVGTESAEDGSGSALRTRFSRHFAEHVSRFGVAEEVATCRSAEREQAKKHKKRVFNFFGVCSPVILR